MLCFETVTANGADFNCLNFKFYKKSSVEHKREGFWGLKPLPTYDNAVIHVVRDSG